ncbi:hypothetical protein MMC22_012014 [Lobaria immixta]|nr:hypothetical protein [Lobaria immixta]
MASTRPALSKPSWQEIVKQAQEARDASLKLVDPAIPDVPSELPLDVTEIPKYLLSTEEAVITQTAPEELVASLASGRLKSVAVVTAFLRRAGIAQKLTNCITELLPEQALARAKSLDDFYARHKKPVGPLHGLPISVKEHIEMKGLGINVSFVSWWGRKGEDDAPILKILWDAGCIFYARTTQPQSLMHLETSSNLYGVTVNPFNSNLSSGGSSGGEGALIGLRGSCLGIGTDIGGSIRSPAASCGVYGLRPTSYRLPNNRAQATMMGEEQIVPVIGPISTSLEGVKLFMKTIIAARPWLVEPSLVPFPWRDQESHLEVAKGEKLKIGVIWSDEVVTPHPPVRRALKEVVAKLREVEDFEIVDWKPYKHDEAWEIISSLYFCDGGKEGADAIDLSGEPWRPLSTFAIKSNPNVKRLSIEEVWSWTLKREAYRAAYAKVWNDTGNIHDNSSEKAVRPVDVILCPAGPGTATLLDTAKYWCYLSQWNLLDYPAVIFPVSKVDPQVDVVDEQYKPLNEKDEFNHKLCQFAVTPFYGSEVFFKIIVDGLTSKYCR